MGIYLKQQYLQNHISYHSPFSKSSRTTISFLKYVLVLLSHASVLAMFDNQRGSRQPYFLRGEGLSTCTLCYIRCSLSHQMVMCMPCAYTITMYMSHQMVMCIALCLYNHVEAMYMSHQIVMCIALCLYNHIVHVSLDGDVHALCLYNHHVHVSLDGDVHSLVPIQSCGGHVHVSLDGDVHALCLYKACGGHVHPSALSVTQMPLVLNSWTGRSSAVCYPASSTMGMETS